MTENEMSWNKVWTLLVAAAGVAGMELWSKKFTLGFIVPAIADLQLLTELVKLIGQILIVGTTLYFIKRNNGSRKESSDHRN